ncbi:MAG: hypothetical protein ACRESZ_22025 [Methylococcales bacterium]
MTFSADVPLLEVRETLATPLHITTGTPTFVISKHGTTPAFDKQSYLFIDQSITCIPDPLGINGETLIGQRRTERPQSKARPAPGVSFHKQTFEAIFPLFAHPENEWLLSALIEGIENTEILNFVYKELDAIRDTQRVDNLKKKILLNPSVPEAILYDTCMFCNVKQAQVRDALGIEGSAISINNDFPFGPVLHKVLILQERKHDISEITPDEIFHFYELMHTIAVKAKATYGDELDGLTYGMNYGLPRIYKGSEIIASGASQPHLHSQISALTRTSFNAGDRVGLMCKAYREKYNRNYLEDYESALRNTNLILDENEHAILYVPVAQRFNYEVQIMVKNDRIGNILDTSPEVRKSVGSLEHSAYQIYQHRDLNIQSFNTLMYTTRLSAENDYAQRLIISIYPRTAIIALS